MILEKEYFSLKIFNDNTIRSNGILKARLLMFSIIDADKITPKKFAPVSPIILLALKSMGIYAIITPIKIYK